MKRSFRVNPINMPKYLMGIFLFKKKVEPRFLLAEQETVDAN